MAVIPGQAVTAYPLPDEELSPTSKNAVSNEAVCEGLDELKNTLNANRYVFNEGKIDLGTLIPGVYISGGGESSSSSYTATGFIPIKGLVRIYIFAPASRGQKYTGFYDSGENYIPDSSFYINPGINVVDIPSGAYFVRISERTENMENITVTVPAFYNEDVKPDVAQLFNDGEIKYGDLITNTYIANGNVSTISGYKATQPIHVHNLGKIVVYMDVTGSRQYNAFYNEYGQYITDSKFTTNSGYNIITVPANAYYMRLSETNDNMATLKLYDYFVYRIGNNVNLATTEKNTLVGAINEIHGKTVEYTSLDGFTKNGGEIIYDTTWHNISVSKHAVIPIKNGESIVEITASAQLFLVGVTDYGEVRSGESVQNLSAYWVRRIEVAANSTFRAYVPPDVKYLLVNCEENSTSLISSFKLTTYEYDNLIVAQRNAVAMNRITVGTQNVRDFGDGTGDGCPDNLVEEKMPLWKEQFNNWLNRDFLVLEEYYPYFDRSRTIDSYNTFLKQFYPYYYALPVSAPTHIILSKYPGVYTDLAYFAKVGFSMPMVVCHINGKSVAIVCWMQSSADTPEIRIPRYQAAITALAQYDKVILAGDFNTDVGLEELETFTNAGYVLGNGGWWGTFNTWENRTPNDNIVTKGFIYENFEVGNAITSDHKPVRATVCFAD